MQSVQGSQKRIETFSRIIHIIIAFILGMFLIALGDKILSDLDEWYAKPSLDSVYSLYETTELSEKINSLVVAENSLRESMDHIQKLLQSADEQYQTEKQSFDNWVKSRKTIGKTDQDPEIVARLNALDSLTAAKKSWQTKKSILADSLRTMELNRKSIGNELNQVKNLANESYNDELRSYNLKIFLIRLVFAIPILLLGVFLFIKYRATKLKAFVWGYIFFSLYIFFIGLVPYFPSYGGYVRYIVGIVLTVFVGYYLIKQVTVYFERKREELKKSMKERLEDVKEDTAVKSYKLHVCPSCEKDYMIMHDSDKKPNYCIHCGFILFMNCSKCGQRNFAHFNYCSSCGIELEFNESAEA